MTFRPFVSRLVLIVLAVGGAAATLRAQAPAPLVTGMWSPEKRKDGEIELGRVLRVDVKDLSAWMVANKDKKLVPFLNGLPIRGNYPQGIGEGVLHFEPSITKESREAWMALLGEPMWGRRGFNRQISLSVGPEDAAPFATVFDGKEKAVTLVVIAPVYGVLSLVVIVATLVTLLWLARHTGILRDKSTPPGKPLEAYNLGRVQMAFWFFLTFTSYIVIWLITDAVDTLTASIVGLIGISATTALSEALIDANKETAATDAQLTASSEKNVIEQTIADNQAQLDALLARPALTTDETVTRDRLVRLIAEEKAQLGLAVQRIAEHAAIEVNVGSRGFWRDILCDGTGGYSFHRFQIVAWTIVLGGIFLIEVYNNLTMPEFSATLLALMGMSSGTFIGFKFPEKR